MRVTRNRTFGIFLILLLSFWLPPGALLAQEPAPQMQEPARKTERPRIGLALAGGSARGLAHVGILKWLYEHHIPVEAVAGTSMGGLVGGLFAAGYTPEEIERLLERIDWEEVLSLAPPYDKLSFRRRQDRREYPIQFELGLRRGLRPPSGLSAGHGVGLVLSQFTAPYIQMKSFDDLPTPFRCVAVDLVTGKQVVFQEGDLFDALRATMSLPGIFAPAQLGDKVLVDGGTLNNLPADVVKEMGAGLVIVVTLGLPDKQDLASLSLLGVADRSIDIMIADNVMRNLQLADLVLAPDLKGLYSLDFTKFREFVERGYAEAQRKARFLEPLAVDDATWQAYLAERARRRRPEYFTPQFVRVEGARKEQTAELERKVSKLAGQPVDFATTDDRLTRLTGLGRYDRADYRQTEEANQAGLLVRVHEKSYGPPILNTFVDVAASEVGDFRFGAGIRVTVMDLGGAFSELRTDLRVGSANRIGSEYYWRILGTKWFLAPRGFIDYSSQNLFQGNTQVGDYRVEEFGAGVDLGLALTATDEVRLGYEASHLKAFPFVGSPTLPRVEGLVSKGRVRWAHDSMDSPIIPRRGVRFGTDLSWVLESPVASNDYPVVEARLAAAAPLTPRLTFITSLSGGTTAGKMPFVPAFALGGPFRLSALSREQRRGNNYYYGGFHLLRSLSEQPLTFLKHTYLGFSYELGDAFNSVEQSNSFHSGTLGIYSETFLGALFFGVSVGEEGQHKAFFRLGRVF